MTIRVEGYLVHIECFDCYVVELFGEEGTDTGAFRAHRGNIIRTQEIMSARWDTHWQQQST